jgi:hypothetical protein
MACFDYDDLKERLIIAGFLENSEVFNAVTNLAATLDNEEISDINREIVLEIFSKTALEQINKLPKEFLSKNKWMIFDYGNVKKGDYVRVRYDAYDSPEGSKHNGRLGILIDMKAWRCKVQYIGMPQAETMVHPMDNLESIRKI